MKLGLGLSLANRGGAGGLSSPIPSAGLSLWLKADAGVTSSQTPFISQVILTGFTGIYASANGTYNGNSEDQYFEHTSGLFYIEGNTLFEASMGIPIATNSNNYQGAWTPVQYFSTITLSNAGTTSVNGVYTRTESYDIEFSPFLASGGRSISWDDEALYWTTQGGYYLNYSEAFDEEWSNENGAGPQPDAVYSNSSRNVGSPTSTITGVYPVNSWADQSGNGKNAYPNNGYQSLTTIGSNSFIQFLASADMAFSPIWETGIIGTIIIVAHFTSSSSRGNIFRHDTNNYSFQFGRGISGTNAFFLNQDTDPLTNYVISNVNVGNNSKNILTATFSTSTSSLFLNGTSCGSGSGVNLNGVGNGYLGASISSSDTYKIGEVIIYNRVITTTERQQVEAYLNAKYAIY